VRASSGIRGSPRGNVRAGRGFYASADESVKAFLVSRSSDSKLLVASPTRAALTRRELERSASSSPDRAMIGLRRQFPRVFPDSVIAGNAEHA
jgi:hypothetical protein